MDRHQDATYAPRYLWRGRIMGKQAASTARYSVCVRFRKSKLPLKRGLALEAALSFAQTQRAVRFHSPEDVFVLNEASGAIVDEREHGTDPQAAAADVLAEGTE